MRVRVFVRVCVRVRVGKSQIVKCLVWYVVRLTQFAKVTARCHCYHCVQSLPLLTCLTHSDNAGQFFHTLDHCFPVCSFRGDLWWMIRIITAAHLHTPEALFIV